MQHHPEHLSDDALELSVAAVAAAMADPSRVKMLCALMDGRAWTATELSVAAGVAASTASAHLSKLVDSQLVCFLSQGRHRYYRLAGKEVARLIEMMMGISWRRDKPFATRTPVALRHARTCYDHLAGELAVSIYDALVEKEYLTADGASLTEEGLTFFTRVGLPLESKSTRKRSCACLDWSERRFHLGGHAGAVLLIYFETKGWIRRTPGFREVTLTAKGRQGLQTLLGIDVR
ncbi:transcriptional regulator [Enterobacter hormaechei]|uniref:Winged helix-turn-helix domain-containing protein n=1 Tax=Phytobacter ursingii TaxID=1972431 RepID=A0AB35RH20_9ENTR|nr:MULTISPECIES: winged helix-turn-helix domain-containing protein [Enterobacteriaceae]MDV2861121.1 winged helix-turn-helix domain-containing protein [Phytobacter ursingii]GJL34271.1 transcriptional regulator [Enterobacter hormaechei]